MNVLSLHDNGAGRGSNWARPWGKFKRVKWMVGMWRTNGGGKAIEKYGCKATAKAHPSQTFQCRTVYSLPKRPLAVFAYRFLVSWINVPQNNLIHIDRVYNMAR